MEAWKKIHKNNAFQQGRRKVVVECLGEGNKFKRFAGMGIVQRQPQKEYYFPEWECVKFLNLGHPHPTNGVKQKACLGEGFQVVCVRVCAPRVWWWCMWWQVGRNQRCEWW